MLLILLLVTVFSDLQAQQEFSTQSRRAGKNFREALEQYRLREHSRALEKLDRALKYDEDFIEAYILKGQIYEEQEDLTRAIDLYRKAIQIDVEFYPRILYNTAQLEFRTGDYREAKDLFVRYRDRDDTGPAEDARAEHYLASCDFALDQLDHPVSFSPQNLGANVNSPYDEYWPSISADGQTLVFTRLIPREDMDQMKSRLARMDQRRRQFLESMMSTEQEDFFVSHRRDTGWTRAVNLGSPINTRMNEGAQSLSADGKTMYFSACNKKGGEGGCDIYISRFKDGQWTAPENPGPPVNTSHWESQPSISPDGRTLYFSSSRKGGKGKKDLWKSIRNADGSWQEPVNLGDSINTPGEEMAPFIHMDNKTLYFSSDGRIGMGGMDLFKSQMKSNNQWTQPVNLGYPINTHHDEFGLIVNAPGDRAFYASSQKQGNNKDIYAFKLHSKARPVPSSYMRGRVYNEKTGQPLKAKFELIGLDSGKVIMEAYSDSQSGEFLVSIPANNNYLLNVSRKHFLFYSDHFTLKGIHEIGEPFEKDVPLKPVEAGEVMVLRNVFFETDSFRLKEESMHELDKLHRFLNTNPGVRIEISGHTDSIGTRQYNQELSHKRARSVYRYLIGKGVDSQRLEYKGYGESRPTATNQTPEGRARNRRTQIEILEDQPPNP